jgi:Lytic transglycolase
MKKALKKILECFDWCIERIWEIFGFMCLIVWSIMCLFGRGTVLLWHRLGKVKKCHGIWLKFSSFFRFMETVAALILIYPVKWFVILKKRLDGSAGARRITFITVIILYILIRQPFLMPWNWGYNQFYQQGIASWYGPGFYFKRTASGELFLPGPFMTAAHKTLPFGTKVRIRNRSNGCEAVVTINDDGPHKKGRIIDLSWFAAWRLGMTGPGTASVEIYVCPGAKLSRPKKGAK